MEHHPLVQALDAFAAGATTGEREDGVKQASDATQHHARREPAGRPQVLQVSLAYGLWMFSEKTAQSHGRRLGEWP
jgi:hypothetical protein